MKAKRKKYKRCPLCGKDLRLYGWQHLREGKILRFPICPVCNKDIKEHVWESTKVLGRPEYSLKAEILTKRGLPKYDYREWLLTERCKYLQLIKSKHETIDSAVSINHDWIYLLNIWYNNIKLYDNELQNLKDAVMK